MENRVCIGYYAYILINKSPYCMLTKIFIKIVYKVPALVYHPPYDMRLCLFHACRVIANIVLNII